MPNEEENSVATLLQELVASDTEGIKEVVLSFFEAQEEEE